MTNEKVETKRVIEPALAPTEAPVSPASAPEAASGPSSPATAERRGPARILVGPWQKSAAARKP